MQGTVLTPPLAFNVFLLLWHVCEAGAPVPQHTCAEDNLWDLILPFHCESRGQAQVIRPV